MHHPALVAPTLAGIRISEQVVFNGAVLGLVYGILAIGIIIVYRSSGVINFAHSQLGIVGAALLAKLVIDWDWPFFLAVALVLPVGALIGAVTELVVIRRLFEAPRSVVFVATLGVAQLLTLLTLQIPRIEGFAAYPSPVSFTWRVGGIDVRGDQVIALLVTIAVGSLLAWFFGRTIWGVAIRAAASNPSATRLAGISIRALSTIVWTITGVLATITVIVSAPLRSTQVQSLAESAGTGLLLRALAVALLARLRSMPAALVAGAGFGIVESILLFNYPASPGLSEMVLLAVVLLGVLLAPATGDAMSIAGGWVNRSDDRALNARAEMTWIGRHLNHVVGGLCLGAAIVLPFVFDEPSKHFLYSRMVLFAVIALSVSVLTGWAGQLSLGQLAFAGLGAFTVGALDFARLQYVPAVLVATVITVAAAMVVGLPALRVRGLHLAIVTLAFAAAAEAWLFDQSIFVGSRGRARIEPSHVVLGPLDLTTKRTFYFVALASLVVTFRLVARIRRTGVGRSFMGVRDNETCAAAYAVSPVRTKLVAFGVGGGLAGLAGGAYGGLLTQFDSAAFNTGLSIQIVAIAVIGGIGSAPGAVLGTLWVIGLPALFGDSQNIALVTSGGGILILLLYFPGGLIEIANAARRALLTAVVGGDDVGLPAPAKASPPTAFPEAVRRPERSGEPLRVEGLSVSFGSRIALSGVDLHVGTDEIVGVIGANGAGKSTLMNAIGGHVESKGTVELFGEDVAGRSVPYRARLGLGRAFQNAELFGDLSVLETVALASEVREPTSTWRVVTGFPGWQAIDRSQRSHANDLIDFLGLGAFAGQRIGTLSTGTRRITELACLLAFGPGLVCLDEPTAGVAQRETEAFGPLLRNVRVELNAAIMVIEHDMSLVVEISDRMYCLEAGLKIAEGSPSEVCSNPAVIASYLGTNNTAIPRRD